MRHSFDKLPGGLTPELMLQRHQALTAEVQEAAALQDAREAKKQAAELAKVPYSAMTVTGTLAVKDSADLLPVYY